MKSGKNLSYPWSYCAGCRARTEHSEWVSELKTWQVLLWFQYHPRRRRSHWPERHPLFHLSRLLSRWSLSSSVLFSSIHLCPLLPCSSISALLHLQGTLSTLDSKPRGNIPTVRVQLRLRRPLSVVNKVASAPVPLVVAAAPSSVRFRLDNLGPQPGSRKKAKRKGRGIAAGQGASCGFGMRGQKSRSGPGVRKGFEGGQMPLYRRIPKLRGIAGGN